MGVVLRQSVVNTVILFVGFGIGAINTLFLYTRFLQDDYYGLVAFILSSGNILMPLMVLGMQNTIIRFFSSYHTAEERDSFLMASLILPLAIIIPLALISTLAYDTISNWISGENPMIKSYTWQIFLIAVFMGYFEVFYALSRVYLRSVFGNFIKEVFARISVTFLLIAVYMHWLTDQQFIYAVVIVYGLRMLIMKLYAFKLHWPRLVFKLPENIKEILSYSFYIILAGSASGILMDIDKFMIPQMEQIAQVAYYSVGVYIASVIGIPSRAMQQIIVPLTAKAINSGNLKEVDSLYQKSSITLLVAGGLFLLLITVNVKDLYGLIQKPEFMVGIPIVLMLSISELYKLVLGTNGAILSNSKYYKVFFYFSIAMALSVILLNKWLIERIGINGAALSTLVVTLVFSSFKIYYVWKNMQMQPFTAGTFKVLVLTLILFLAFYFIDLPFHPFINVAIKSVLISGMYVFAIVKLHVSDEVNILIARYLTK